MSKRRLSLMLSFATLSLIVSSASALAAPYYDCTEEGGKKQIQIGFSTDANGITVQDLTLSFPLVGYSQVADDNTSYVKVGSSTDFINLLSGPYSEVERVVHLNYKGSDYWCQN